MQIIQTIGADYKAIWEISVTLDPDNVSISFKDMETKEEQGVALSPKEAKIFADTIMFMLNINKEESNE
jgi:hypothetical protein